MAQSPETPPSKRISPLVYIVAILVVAVLAWFGTHWRGTYHPPSGGPPAPQTQAGGENPTGPQAATAPPANPAPPAPNGSGPLNQPGVQTGPAPGSQG